MYRQFHRRIGINLLKKWHKIFYCAALCIWISAKAEDRLNSSLVTVYSGKIFDVVSMPLRNSQVYSRRNLGKLDAASVLNLQNFEDFLMETSAIPPTWRKLLLADRFQIRLLDFPDEKFVARVLDSSGIELNSRFLSRPSAELLLRHEVYHLLRRRQGLPANPEWIEEGLAQYFAFYTMNGAVGYPLEAYLEKPNVDLRKPSLESELRSYAWYGKSFLFVYYLLGQSTLSRPDRLENFWKISEVTTERADSGPTEYVKILRSKLKDKVKISADLYHDFLVATALNRSHAVYDRKYLLFPTTLQLQFEGLRSASKNESCLPHYFWTKTQGGQAGDLLDSWIKLGFKVEKLPTIYPDKIRSIAAGHEIPSPGDELEPSFYLVWCAE